MGQAYTKPVIQACKSVDHFIDVKDFLNGTSDFSGQKPEVIVHVLPNIAIAKKAVLLGIPTRIGTTNRVFHWLTCNKLVKLSRRKSNLHEAQLNVKLLQPLGITHSYSLVELGQLFSLTQINPLPERLQLLIDPNKYNLILHPKSQGNGREWGLENFINLIRLLQPDCFKIFISGVQKEREQIQPLFDAVGDYVTDITGIMSLTEFMSFIASCNGLVASGTGPIHLAAALGKDAFGIYPPIKPIHPGRWAPLGTKAKAFVLDKECSDCKNNSEACICIKAITATQIKLAIEAAAAL